MINALTAEKPERTGLLKPQEQQARTTKKPIAHRDLKVLASFLMVSG